ncbi:MAG: hypothetical protein HKN15_03945, partial [Xanthomonadales bacterium]|nr:hypothetical protein [Xanthomonadales bacterium]
VTGVGTIDGNQVVLHMELTTGGIFNGSDPMPVQDANYGTMTIVFSDCSNGQVTFDFPGAGLSGVFAITRTLNDNVALCESLSP